MPSFYPYLVSSLPALAFGARPPFTADKFIELCEDLIPEDDLKTLRSAVKIFPFEGCPPEEGGVLARWRSFDTMLRNELVKIRASRKKTDPAKYLRQDGCPESAHTAHIAINAYRKPSILESERSLDLERWGELEELAFGHYFDLSALIIYAHKLLILERWDKINNSDNRRLLEDTLAAPSQQRQV